MNTLSVVRIPLAFAFGALITAALFFALWRLTAPVEFRAAPKARAIEFRRTLVDSSVVTKAVVEQEKPEQLPMVESLTLPSIKGDSSTPITPVQHVGDGIGLPQRGFGDTGSTRQIWGGSDKDVTPIVRINPQYPARAENQSIEGWVRVRFSITPTGAVSELQVVASEPRGTFDQATLAAVARWRYNPKVLDGVAVEQRGLEIVLRFNLEK